MSCLERYSSMYMLVAFNHWLLILIQFVFSQSVLAFGDSQMGVILLPTVLYLSKVLAKLAIGLDRKPELIAHLLREGIGSAQDETAEKVTLVEKSANVVREAFIKCLTDRSGTPGTQGKPEGRRVGIYLMANLCLKLLFKVCFALHSNYTAPSRQNHPIRSSTNLYPYSAESYEMLNKCLPVSMHNHPLSFTSRPPKE